LARDEAAEWQKFASCVPDDYPPEFLSVLAELVQVVCTARSLSIQMNKIALSNLDGSTLATWKNLSARHARLAAQVGELSARLRLWPRVRPEPKSLDGAALAR
jgi:hypothetical protein